MCIAYYRYAVPVDVFAVNRRWKSFITTVSSCGCNTIIIIGRSSGDGGGGGISCGCGCCSAVAWKNVTLPVSVTCIVLVRRIFRSVDILYQCCKHLILEYFGIFSK